MNKIIQVTGEWPNLVVLCDNGKLFLQTLTPAGFEKHLLNSLGEKGNYLSNAEEFKWTEIKLNEDND